MERQRYAINVTDDTKLAPRFRRVISRLVRARQASMGNYDEAIEHAGFLAQDLHTVMASMDLEGVVVVTVFDRATFETIDFVVADDGIQRRNVPGYADNSAFHRICVMDDYTCPGYR